MKKTLLSISWWCMSVYAMSQCVTNVDFNSWIRGGQPANGNWLVENGGSQVHQTINGAPTFFYSPFDLMNVEITGNFRTTDDDDDYMGFVFSFLNPMGATDSFDCWLYDWKQAPQQAAPRGMSLNRVNGVIPSSQYTTNFWNHTNGPGFTCVANNFGSAGWVTGFNHAFKIDLTYTRATIYIDGVMKFDYQDCYKVGRFGFYNLSQGDCYYSNFQYSLFIDFTAPANTCLGSATPLTFIPNCGNVIVNQYRSIKWDYGDGTSSVINNPTSTTANVVHTYSAAGSYTVTLTVTDNNNCSMSKSYPVNIVSPITLTPTLTPPLCNGASNGSISVAPSGGLGPFTYIWSGGTQGSLDAGIPAGTYTVSVTDGICNTTAQYTINQPTAVTATTSHTDASCGLANGSATIVITGGTPPYQNVNWAGQPGYTVSGLLAGTYIADFHDANGCSALLQYSETIGSTPCGITSSVVVTNVTCFGGSNGTATLTITGTVGTAVITWSNGATGATATGLAAGTYTYTYSDGDAAHNFTGTVVILQPGAAMVAQLATTGITCPGAADGQAVVSVISGGKVPYQYAWSVGGTNNPVDAGLSPGPVSVTVTDSTGCTATATGNISGQPSLATNFVTVIDSCFHNHQGSAVVNVSGGSPPYTYAWSNFYADTANIHLEAGTYTLTVTDSKNCSVTGSATVGGPATVFVAPYTFTDIKCFGDHNGSFTITASGGTPAYTYVWNPATVSGSNPVGLAGGIYAYTVTDAFNCVAIGADTITEPAAALTATTSHVNVSCNGGNDGKVIIILAGGTPPYNYSGFTFRPGTDTIGNLVAGTYAGVVTDSNSCTVNVSETITQPGLQNVSLTSTNDVCFGGATATATANFVNATGAVTYNWTPGGVQPAGRTNLAAGTYAVTATDANNCTASNTTTITQPTVVTMQAQITDVDCNGAATGSITLTPTGGTGPGYTYAWSPNVSTASTASNLPAAAYTVTVTDQAACTIDSVFTVTQPAVLAATTASADISCNGAHDGTVTVTPTGGTAPFTYAWTPNTANTANAATGLAAGNYSITVTDAHNCSVLQSATIVEPAVLALTQSQTDLVCYHVSTGAASVNVTGGTTPYTYVWNPNAGTTATASNIAAGNYGVTISDAHLCTVTAAFNITEPAQLVVTETHTPEPCFGNSVAQITLTANGGTGNLGYTWNPNVSTTNAATNLPAGSYTYIVTDANACTVSQSVTIIQPAQIGLTANPTDASCYGQNNGAIATTIAGGSSPYNYVLESSSASNQNSSTGQFTNLAAASYEVVVTDANSCVDSVSAVIGSPTQIVNVNDSTNVTCYGLSNGSISIATSGGTAAYSYSLSTGATGNNGIFTGLAAGNYSVTVTDANHCSTTDAINIMQPDSFIISLTPLLAEIKLGDTIQLTASTNQPVGVTYNWEPSFGLSCYDCADPVFNYVSTTSYIVTATTAAGCVAATRVQIIVDPDYDVFIPNVFTPNGDGRNDIWLVYTNLQNLKYFDIKVFNRIGEKVFESHDINEGWDGMYKGQPSPLGVYAYTASFVWIDNHTDTNYKGSLTLLR